MLAASVLLVPGQCCRQCTLERQGRTCASPSPRIAFHLHRGSSTAGWHPEGTGETVRTTESDRCWRRKAIHNKPRYSLWFTSALLLMGSNKQGTTSVQSTDEAIPEDEKGVNRPDLRTPAVLLIHLMLRSRTAGRRCHLPISSEHSV